MDYRLKAIRTVLSPVRIRRAYYHWGACRGGVIPKDQALDIARTTFSPGVRRLMGRVGGKEAFAEGRRDLAELAGIVVTTKAVERVAEALGAEIETWAQPEQALALAGKLLPLQAVPTLCLAIDGTGVPVVPSETAGRSGKAGPGLAKTREVKLGCVFTQIRLDAKGRPLRDEASTTYVGAIESVEAFGQYVPAKTKRRSEVRPAPSRRRMRFTTASSALCGRPGFRCPWVSDSRLRQFSFSPSCGPPGFRCPWVSDSRLRQFSFSPSCGRPGFRCPWGPVAARRPAPSARTTAMPQ